MNAATTWTCAVFAVAWAFSLSGAEAAQDRSEIATGSGTARNVYITATASNGEPAKDLTPAEVVVREDGKHRDVLALGPAGSAQIALLVDDTGTGIQFIRTGVAEFIHVLQNQAEIAIISTAGQNRVLTDFTSDTGALLAAANRLVTRTTSGGYLLDAIHEWARTLQRREARRPVIVLLALEGKEYSSRSADQVFESVRRSGAVVHVISVGKPTLKTMTSWNQRPTDSIHESLDETMTRGTVLVEAPRRSGGRHEQVLEVSGIRSQLVAIARDIRDQLSVTYLRPPSVKGAQRIQISVTRRGINLRAPKHAS